MSKRFWYYLLITTTFWSLFWISGKFLIDYYHILSFGTYAIFAGVIFGFFKFLLLDKWWRDLV